VTLPGKATHQQTRGFNRGLVLRTLYDYGPVSRAEVARLTGLTRTTVSELVSDVLDEGLVREVGLGPSSGGKAPILLEVIDDARLVVAVDLGERVFAGALVNLRGEVRATREVPADGLDGDEALAALTGLVDELVALAPDPGQILGIGVGTPGLVDVTTGTIRWAVNLDWQDLPLAAILTQRTGLPASVANDSRAAALAEYLFEGRRRAPSLVAVKVGLGIGAGIVIEGEVFNGDGFGAGEIGHTVIVDDGAECRCGRFGCLETVASSRAIVRAATEAAAAHPDSALGRAFTTTGSLTLDDVATALDQGDETARRVVVAAGRSLGQSIAALIGAINIGRVVLLGSVTALGEPWLTAVRDEASRRSLRLLADDTRIEIGRPVDNVVILGAAALLMTRELALVPTR
jgi:predicted NBD/HSP70 family sugar kinase